MPLATAVATSQAVCQTAPIASNAAGHHVEQDATRPRRRAGNTTSADLRDDRHDGLEHGGDGVHRALHEARDLAHDLADERPVVADPALHEGERALERGQHVLGPGLEDALERRQDVGDEPVDDLADRREHVGRDDREGVDERRDDVRREPVDRLAERGERGVDGGLDRGQVVGDPGEHRREHRHEPLADRDRHRVHDLAPQVAEVAGVGRRRGDRVATR